MSFTSENVFIESGSLKGQDHRSASVIAQYNKRRLQGDYGVQPNAPSVGIRLGTDANTSALKATSADLGPKLWRPSASSHAQRASTLASTSSSSFIPEAHYVEDPVTASIANKAATSAIMVSGEEYGAKYQPDAYKWGKTPSQWSHMGASRSAASVKHAESRLTGISSLQRTPPTQSIDITKVLGAAQANAQARLAAAENHLPANFGVQTEEEKALRRQQVLSLISIADKRVKKRLEELNRDSQSSQNIFGSIEFQKIAMDVATRTHGGRLENHGKLDLGGGLYMTQDEVDDIARRNVQPVLDKVQLIADKKRIADREAAEREAAAKQLALEQKETEKKRRAMEKQLALEEKQRKRQNEQNIKQKRQHAEARAKEQHPQGSHLWHWQQVEIIKEEVNEAKQKREEKAAELARVQKSENRAQEELVTHAEHYHELKRDYFSRCEAIETKKGEYDSDAPETASLFELKQQCETAKVNTKNAKLKRTVLRETIEGYSKRITQLEAESEKAQQRYHDLKKKYLEASTEAEEAEKKWQVEEEARLKKDTEERAQKDAEVAKCKKQAAEFEAESKKNEAAAGAEAAEEALPSDFKPPFKSRLLRLGNALIGPVLEGHKTQPAPDTKLEKTTESAKDSTKDISESPGVIDLSKPGDAKGEAPIVKAPETSDAKAADADTTKDEKSPIDLSKPSDTEEESPCVKAHEFKSPAKDVIPKAESDTSVIDSSKPRDSPAETSSVETNTEVAISKVESCKKGLTSADVPEASKAESSEAASPSYLLTEETSGKGTLEKAPVASKNPIETEKVGKAVAGSVVLGSAKLKLADEIPLEEKKDDFKDFESSNVKEQIADDSPGVFKEDL